MKRLKISEEQMMNFYSNENFIMEWAKHVQEKLAEAGFDLKKTIVQEFSQRDNHVVFTQED